MILITGSKGLIGNNLKKCLTILDIPFLGMDTGYPNNHHEYGNIQNIELLEKIVIRCTGIIHLAGVSRVAEGEKAPKHCWDCNVLGTQNVLEAAINSPKKPWVIFASSREVYGQQTKLPISEGAPLKPVNVYGRSKVAAEQIVRQYRKKGLQTAIIRFSNVYGSIEDHADRVIPAFCKIAAVGGTMQINGAGNIFDFTHVNDVVEGIIKVVRKLQEDLQDFQTIHFASGHPTTLKQVAEFAKSVSKVPINFLYLPSYKFGVNTFYGDPSRAIQTLGWETRIGVKEGILQLVRQFENQLEIKSSIEC